MNTIIHADRNDYLESQSGEWVDCILTSPPYHERHGYSKEFITRLAKNCFRSQVENGICFVNFGVYARDPHRPEEVRQAFEDAGYIWQTTMIWLKSLDGKGHYTPINSKNLLNNMFEYIFVFAKNGKRELDRLSIGIPHTDPSNAKRWNGNTVRCNGDVLFVPHATINSKSKRNHSYQFPKELVRRLLKLANLNKGDLVLDPCAGSGVVGIVAEELGFSFVGIEKDLDVWKNSLIQNKAKTIGWL